jgi:hypothetical protein
MTSVSRLITVIAPVEGALAEAAEIEHRLAQRLAGNGAAMNANAAEFPLLLDDGRFLAEFRGADGALLSCRSASKYDQVVVISVYRHSGIDLGW